MKKNVFTILLALALVLSCVIVAAPSVSAEETAAHSHCVCVRSEAKPADHVCDETIVWEPYVKGMTLVDGGHYYLTGDVGETRNLTSSDNKLNITICLNGHTFRAQTPFKVQNGNTLTICDCVGGGAIRSSKVDATGYSIWAGYNKAVVNLYSGILSGQISNGVYGRPVVVDGGTFNMYGGTIKNGDSGTITTGSPNVGYGGNVLIKSYQGSSTHVGTFNLFGGTIEGGKATANGGNIYVLGGVLNISGGIIKNGSAVNGGNIAANGDYIKDDQSAKRKVDLTISGGTVENGVATEKGGNIYLQNTTNGCILAIKGTGLVTGGKAAMGGNIASYKNNPTTGLTGGTISNGVATLKGGNVYVESLETTSNTFTLKGTTISGGVAKKVETVDNGDGTTTENIVWGDGGNIYFDSNSKVAINSGTVTAGEAGYGGNIYIAADMGEIQSFACQITDGVAHNNGGNIYTASALTLGEITVSGGKASANGGNILCDKKVLTLNGTTVSGGEAGSNGGNIAVTNTGAQLIMTDATVANGTATTGGNIYTLNVPTVTITGGAITGGTASNHGGNMYATHTSLVATRKLTMNEVTVSDGTAENNGGNLYIAKVGVVKLENVTCENGIAKDSGSNVYLTLNHDVTVSGGEYTLAEGGRNYTYTYSENSQASEEEKAAFIALVAQYGLNRGDTKLVSEGGRRLDGDGGNICLSSCGSATKTVDGVDTTVAGSATITGATIIGGNAVNGGALYVGDANVTIENLTAKTCGGNSGRVLHVSKNAEVTLKDSTLVNWGTMGTTIHNHGQLHLVGEIKLDKEFNANERKNGTAALTNGIVLDCTENENAMVDISGLTAVAYKEEEGMPTVTGIQMVRYGEFANDKQTKLPVAGQIATGVNDTNRGMIWINNTGFSLVETEGNLFINDKLIQGLNSKGSVTAGGNDFAELTQNHKSDVLYYIVNDNLEVAGELGVNIVLDLNGKTVNGASVAAGKTLQLMENKNDGYNADTCGKIFVTGTVDPITHIVAPVGNRHYVALPNEDGSWSAHRYLAYIKAVSLKADADALGFKGGFTGDATVQAAVTGYGFKMNVAGGPVKVYTKEGSLPAKNNELALRVKNIMAGNGGEVDISGNAFISFIIGGQSVYAETSATTTNMKSTIRAVNGLTNLNDAQKTSVYNLYTQYQAVMNSWFTTEETNNIATWGAPAAEETAAA